MTVSECSTVIMYCIFIIKYYFEKYNNILIYIYGVNNYKKR